MIRLEKVRDDTASEGNIWYRLVTTVNGTMCLVAILEDELFYTQKLDVVVSAITRNVFNCKSLLEPDSSDELLEVLAEFETSEEFEERYIEFLI